MLQVRDRSNAHGRAVESGLRDRTNGRDISERIQVRIKYVTMNLEIYSEKYIFSGTRNLTDIFV